MLCHIALYGYTVLTVAVSLTAGKNVFESTYRTIKRQSLRCNNYCPYGFVADVEGRLTCMCYDPCASIMCVQAGHECVAEMPEKCLWEPCIPKTTCKEAPDMVLKHKKEAHVSRWNLLNEELQSDTPNGLSSDVCEQALPREAVACDKPRRRWSYDHFTGKCQPFTGCPTSGNNFSRKRNCKSKCRRNVVHPSILRTLAQDETSCSDRKPVSSSSCTQKTRRWFYNENTGKCEKFIGCDTTETKNIFTRKVYCKTICRQRILGFRQQQSLGPATSSVRYPR